MVPTAFVFLTAMPLTPTGKIARKELPEPELLSATRQFQAPSNEIEFKLCQIWQQLLAVEQVGIHDNFFELGGHSLLANSLVMAINSTFNVSFELITIFKAQTIAEIAVKLAALQLLNTLPVSHTEVDDMDALELTI
jgi:acyl carrier protein